MPQTILPTHAAQAASSFRASVGVNTHLDYTNPPYTNLAMVQQSLAYLGIAHVRDAFGAPGAAALFQAVAAQGVSFDFVLSPSQPVPWQFQQMEANASIADLIEGPNESDNWTATYNGLTGLDATRAMQRDLYAYVHASAALAGKTVLQASLANPDLSSSLGNLSDAADAGNIHAYFGTGNTPGSGLGALLADAQIVSPGLPVIASEGGYYTRPDAVGGVSALAQAKDTLNLLLDDAIAGVGRTYLYELADEAADPASAIPNDHFGLYNQDWTPKPAATALHNFNSLIGEGGGTGTLAYQITGAPGTGHDLLLQRADGSFVITLWNDIRNWDPVALKDVANPGVSVALDLGQSYRSITLYDPLVSATVPLASYTDVRHIDLALLDHPVLVVVAPLLSAVQSPSIALAGAATEGASLGNLWAQIVAAGQAADPGRALTVSAVSLTGTRGFVTFDAAHQVLSYLANGYDAAAPVDGFSFVLTDAFGATVTGFYNVTISGPARPTQASTVAGAVLYAAAPGTRLISEAAGQRLNGAAGGNTLFFAGRDTIVAAYGLGNTIVAAPGDHASIVTGAGNATVRMGDGNQTVVAPGAGNVITLGTGNSSVSSSGGNETVVVAGGNARVYVTGAGNRVTTGAGTDAITALGGGATVDAGDGDNTVTVSLTGNLVYTGSGADVIGGMAGNTTADAGAGNDIIRFGGSGSRILGGLGDDQLYDSGTGNTYVLNRAGEGTDQIYGNLSTNAATYDLRTALSGTSWSGDPAVLGNFLQVASLNGNTTVSISPAGQPGGFIPVAVLHATGTLTLAAFLAQSVLPPMAKLGWAVAEGASTENLWPVLTAYAQSLDPWSRGTYAVSAIDGAALSGAVQFDPAAHVLRYQASGLDPAAPSQSLGFTLSDGLGHSVAGQLVLTVTGAALPTLSSSLAGATVRATAPGMRLLRGAAGQTLAGAMGGATSVFAGADARVLLYGTGNTVQTLPGQHVISGGSGGTTVTLAAGNNSVALGGTGNTVIAGAGNNVVSAGSGGSLVALGDGDSSVTVTGAGNSVRTGNGAATIRGGTGGQVIATGNGSASITVSGAGNSITTGNGPATITASGSASRITTASGNDWISAGGTGNTVSAGDGDDTILAFGGGSVLLGGAGNDVIRFAGNSSRVDGGSGNDQLYDSGSMNTLVLGGGGLTHVYGNILGNGDVLDLRAAMAGTGWGGDAATLGQYLSVRADAGNATLTLAGADIAVLHGTGTVSLASVVNHALLKY